MATYARAGTLYEIGLQELGEGLIRESFREAANFLLGFTANVVEAQSLQTAVMFIQGSGLEATIASFGIAMDANNLRGAFQWKLRAVRWSSATTLDGHSLKGALPVSRIPAA